MINYFNPNISLVQNETCSGIVPVAGVEAVTNSPHSIQTSSGGHPASYRVDTSGSISGGESSRVVKLTTHLYLFPRSSMVELHLHTPISLPSIVLNYIIKYRDNFTLPYFFAQNNLHTGFI
jgi:hypothetical protein